MSLRKIKIKHRLILLFVSISILPIIGIGVFGYQHYKNSLKNKIQESLEQNIRLINQNVDREVLAYQHLSDWIMLEEIIQEYLNQEEEMKLQEKNYVSYRLDRILSEKGLVTQYIKNIVIFDNGGEVFFDIGYDGVLEKNLAYTLNNIEQNGNRFYWEYVKTYRGLSTVVLGRNLYNRDFSQEKIGKLMLFLDGDLFKESVIEKAEIIEGMELVLVNKDGIVISANEEYIKPGSQYIEDIHTVELPCVKDKESIIYGVPNQLTGWWLVLKVPYEYMYAEITKVGTLILWLLVILIGGCIGVVRIIYQSIMHPIEQMIGVCKQVAQNDLKVRMIDEGEDEITYLSKQFNKMLIKIEQLIVIQQKDSIKKRELEIQMLQYQINPHFLFNTLGTLKWIATVNGDEVVSEGIASLAGLLQGTLVNKDEYITIEQELENLKNYFAIQKLRYVNSFRTEYEVEEVLLKQKILKFILQPIAENSILHGIKEAEEDMLIAIRIYSLQEKVCIELKDTGCGFRIEEDVRRIDPKKLTGIGVNNVAERIKLSYGKEYGVYIESEIGIGTTTKIIVPK